MDDITESKAMLKSYCVENGYEKPTYEFVSKMEEGVRHFYTVKVDIIGLITADGEGVSRRIAEYKAAINALKELNVIKDEKSKDLDKKENKNIINEKDFNINKQNDNEIKPKSNPEMINGKQEVVEKVEEKDNKLKPNVIDPEVVNGKQEVVEDVEENDDKLKPKIIDQEVVNGKQEVKENDVNTNDKHKLEESFNIESEEFVRSVRNSISGKSSESKESVDSISDSSSDQNSDEKSDKESDGKKDETMDSKNSTDGGINRSNSSAKNVSFSEETKHIENNKSNVVLIPKFRPIVKNAVSVLLEFCMKNRSPLPFYDNSYTDGSFWAKCRVELDSDNGKTEFLGLGCGDTMRKAKLIAAEDVKQQLKEKNLI